jgi:type II secretory pathway pseudopilin PulG
MASGSSPPRPRRPPPARGVAYLLVLFAVGALGLTAAGTGQVWHTVAQRERETELLFVGEQFRQALAAYRDRSPEGTPSAPASLDDLLEDRRHPVPVRHLRRVWRDPMNPHGDWGLVRAGGRIVGIHSLHDAPPLRTRFEERDAAFAGLASYTQWVFVPAPRPPAAATDAPPP